MYTWRGQQVRVYVTEQRLKSIGNWATLLDWPQGSLLHENRIQIQHSAASGEAAYRLTNHYRLQVVIGTIIAEMGGVRFSYGAQEHVQASDPSWRWSGVLNVCFNGVMCTHLLLEVMGCFAVII